MLSSDARDWPERQRLRWDIVVDDASLPHVDCKHPCAPVAQMDRAVASGATGREFESLRAHHLPKTYRPPLVEAPRAGRSRDSRQDAGATMLL
jgi:hypothetical protein